MAIKNVSVRIPEDLHAQVKVSAIADNRSLNSQIIWLLRSRLGQREASVHVRPGKPTQQ